MKKERINSVDSIKGIACCVIAFCWHYLNMQSKSMGMPFQSILGIFYDYGQYFVELFFMISGFVMAYCYKDKIEKGETFFLYIAKRYRHLYPLFFVTLLYMIFAQSLYWLLFGESYVYQTSAWHLVLNVLCIQAGWFTLDQSFNGPAWCISVEIFLYILFYISVNIGGIIKKNLSKIFNLTIFVCAVLFIYLDRWNYPIFNIFMMRGVACFYAGVLIYDFSLEIGEEEMNKISGTLLLGLILLRISLMFLPYSFWENEKYGQILLIIFQWPIVLIATVYFRPLRKIMEVKPLLYLGRISMDIFLCNIPVQITIKIIDRLFNLKINYGSLGVWVVYIVLVICVSVISHYFISIRKVTVKYIILTVITIIMLITMTFVIKRLELQMKAVLDNSISYTDMCEIVLLEKDTKVSEDFFVQSDTYLKRIDFYTITWNKGFDDNQLIHIEITNRETGESIYSIDRYYNCFSDGRDYRLIVENEVELKGNTCYTITFSSTTYEGQEVMALMLVNKSQNDNEAIVNSRQSDGHISLKIWTQKLIGQ